MNVLTEYIKNQQMVRQLIKEARLASNANKDRLALGYLIAAFDSFLSANNCIASKVFNKKPKQGRSRK